ncbi:MAG: bifunctional phosphopantothenoylcysteine decarboxylase/phosphopantothenate--cysteine ligase CoaBC [archaeon]
MKGKTILIGITGSIALFKTKQLISDLEAAGAKVIAIMTKNARRLMNPDELGCDVACDMFEEGKDYRDYLTKEITHVSLAELADLVVVAPATANIIGKVACGIADDLLSTTIMATKARVAFAPAMESHMYLNPIVQQNIEKLKSAAYVFIGPDTGRLASGRSGIGRLADTAKISAFIRTFFSGGLEKKKVLVTAGPTREYIDPVRYISNDSSGTMGFAVARACIARGARVTLVHGTRNHAVDVNEIRVVSADEMHKEVMNHSDADIIIGAAAVADFTAVPHYQKLKKRDRLTLELKKTPDILAELGRNKRKGQILVGFCLETNDLIKRAKGKLKNKNLDLIVANTPEAIGRDEAKAYFIDRESVQKVEGSKLQIADWLVERVMALKGR